MSPPVLTLRNNMSPSLRLLKSPKPDTCQSRLTVPRNEAPVICIIIDVVDFQSASTTVTQDQVALGAVIADTCHLPVQADRAQEGEAVVVADVVDLKAAGR